MVLKLEDAADRAMTVGESMAETSGKMSELSDEALTGVFGGAIGAGLGLAIGTALTTISVAMTVPICMLIGMTGGIMCLRYWRRSQPPRQLTAQDILGEIKSLPDDAPARVVDALYDQYLLLTTNREQPLALPPPDETGNLQPVNTDDQQRVPVASPRLRD